MMTTTMTMPSVLRRVQTGTTAAASPAATLKAAAAAAAAMIPAAAAAAAVRALTLSLTAATIVLLMQLLPRAPLHVQPQLLPPQQLTAEVSAAHPSPMQWHGQLCMKQTPSICSITELSACTSRQLLVALENCAMYCH
jgi:hypothetical protein